MALIVLAETSLSYRCSCGYDVFYSDGARSYGPQCARCHNRDSKLQPQFFWKCLNADGKRLWSKVRW